MCVTGRAINGFQKNGHELTLTDGSCFDQQQKQLTMFSRSVEVN
jgi:hypothetical protein